MNFRKRGVTPIWKISLQILVPPEKSATLFSETRWRGSKAVWSFSENSSKSANPIIPKCSKAISGWIGYTWVWDGNLWKHLFYEHRSAMLIIDLLKCSLQVFYSKAQFQINSVKTVNQVNWQIWQCPLAPAHLCRWTHTTMTGSTLTKWASSCWTTWTRILQTILSWKFSTHLSTATVQESKCIGLVRCSCNRTSLISQKMLRIILGNTLSLKCWNTSTSAGKFFILSEGGGDQDCFFRSRAIILPRSLSNNPKNVVNKHLIDLQSIPGQYCFFDTHDIHAIFQQDVIHRDIFQGLKRSNMCVISFKNCPLMRMFRFLRQKCYILCFWDKTDEFKFSFFTKKRCISSVKYGVN